MKNSQDNEELIKILISDLVKLAMEGHDLILKCNVPGEYTKEAYSFMEKCSGVFNTFVQHPDADTGDNGSSSEGSV